MSNTRKKFIYNQRKLELIFLEVNMQESMTLTEIRTPDTPIRGQPRKSETTQECGQWASCLTKRKTRGRFQKKKKIK